MNLAASSQKDEKGRQKADNPMEQRSELAAYHLLSHTPESHGSLMFQLHPRRQRGSEPFGHLALRTTTALSLVAVASEPELPPCCE